MGTQSPGDRTSIPEQLSMGLEAAIVRFGALVRRVAWRHKLEGDDLDEVLQDVRLRLWRARGDSEQLATISASYVYRTASSAALDLIRRRRRAREVPLAPIGAQESADDSVDDIASGSVSPGNPEANLEAAELGRAITKAIEHIVPSRRAVVRMYLMGHPPMEIANLMGWTEPKTRNLLYRGLADLRGELTAMGYDPGAGGP
jgi:RNA polymerase sigma factor (sigma-70 family)